MNIPRICLNEAEAAESLGMTPEEFGRVSEFFMPRIFTSETDGTPSFVYPVKELQEWASEQWQGATLFECALCGKSYQIDRTRDDSSPDKDFCSAGCRAQEETR